MTVNRLHKAALVTFLVGALTPAYGQTCSSPDASPTVVIGTQDSGVINRIVSGNCTIDDLINDEQQWGNQGLFISHVSKITFDLLKEKKISALERIKISAAAQQSGIGTTLKVKLIGFNDFHGNIKASEGSSSNPGVARFATKIAELKAQNSLHAVVSAGDMIGASPLTSALFKDEPTIEAMNRIGIDFNAVGNHEFDEGKIELLRMQNGGNHPTDVYSGKGLPTDLNEHGQFAGAKFKFLAANVIEEASDKTLFPGVGIKSFLGNKVAFVGMTLEGTPTIVSPSGVKGLSFKDEADTVNALIPKLKAEGIKSVVVLIHEGGAPVSTGINDCVGISGAIVDVVNRFDPEIDLVISGHTHRAYNCLLNNAAGKPVRVTSAGQFARLLTDIDLTIDTRTKDVVNIVANNIAVLNSPNVVEDPSLLEVVKHYDSLSATPRNRIIGKITATLSNEFNAAGESSIGDVIADAQLDATHETSTGGAVIAFMNPGGIRAALPFSAAGKVDGNVTYGEAFTVQPFGNALVTLTLTGAQIDTLLEEQFTGCTLGYPAGGPVGGQPFNRILQISNGFTYSWNISGTACNKVDASSIKLNGVTISPAANYRITVNSFLADGGDQFYVLTAGASRLGGAVDTDALEAYFVAHPLGVVPSQQDRIMQSP